jgi:hypothetical protein
MNLTWKQLAEEILTMSEELQDTDVTIYDDNDEFMPLNGGEDYDRLGQCIVFYSNSDILDKGHPFISIVPIGLIKDKISLRPILIKEN